MATVGRGDRGEKVKRGGRRERTSGAGRKEGTHWGAFAHGMASPSGDNVFNVRAAPGQPDAHDEAFYEWTEAIIEALD